MQPVDNRYKAILVWGGLRGAVTIVLAMVAAGDQRLPENVREFVALLGHAVRAVHAVRQRHHARPGHARARARQAERASSSRCATACWPCRGSTSRTTCSRSSAQHNARVEGIDADPASAGDAEIEAPPAELALDLDERVKVGLVTLCTREKELYLEQFEQQILSRRMVAVLTARADRLIDAVRDHGAAGYEQMAARHLAARPRLPAGAVAAPPARLRARC